MSSSLTFHNAAVVWGYFKVPMDGGEAVDSVESPKEVRKLILRLALPSFEMLLLLPGDKSCPKFLQSFPFDSTISSQ